MIHGFRSIFNNFVIISNVMVKVLLKFLVIKKQNELKPLVCYESVVLNFRYLLKNRLFVNKELKKTQICLHSKEYLALYLACISTVTFEFCEFRSHALETILITIHPMKNGEIKNFELKL